ncbi:MAG: hypothetical protein U5K81_16235 [Trueperaceae bacterium]|nr:hypothetical protein [Trueperaceae bacterium]
MVAIDGGDAQAESVADLLEASGYEVSSLGGSLADMRRYQDVGVLYLDTHGAAYRPVTDIDEDGPELGDARYALQTATEVELEEAWFDAHQDELQAGDLVISIDANQGAAPDMVKVAVTERFITKHWDLAGGFAMIHACYFGADPFQGYDPRPMRNAVLQSARRLVSFDNYTNAAYAQGSIQHAFRMLLGRGTWNRPWDTAYVRPALAEMGLDRFQKPDWTLGPFAFGGDEVNMTFHGEGRLALRPAIERIEVRDNAADQEGKLVLRGQFGSEPGRVFLSGTELEVQRWSASEVVAVAPLDRSGRVYATVHDAQADAGGDELRSNEVPLTKWSGRISALVSHPLARVDKRVEYTVFTRFRADVHPTRDDPTDATTAFPERVRSYVSPNSYGTVQASGSDASLPGTRWTGGKDIDWILDQDDVENGEPEIPSEYGDFSGGSDDSFFGGYVELRPRMQEAEMCLRLYGVHTEVMDASTPDEYLEYTAPLRDARTHPDLRAASDGTYCLTFDIPDLNTMNVAGETVEVVADDAAGPFDIWLNWSAFQATEAP